MFVLLGEAAKGCSGPLRPNDLAQLVSVQLNSFTSPEQNDLIQTYCCE